MHHGELITMDELFFIEGFHPHEPWYDPQMDQERKGSKVVQMPPEALRAAVVQQAAAEKKIFRYEQNWHGEGHLLS